MLAPIASEVLSDLIGGIYDCALAPQRWPALLDKLHRQLDLANASLSAIAISDGRILLNVLTGPAPEWIAVVDSYGADVVEQWGGAERMNGFPLGEPLVLSQVRPRAEWTNNRFFREWAGPQGIHDVLAVGLTRDASMVSSIGMGRHGDAGEIGEWEVEAMRLLAPHLRRALTISKLLDVQSLTAATFRTTIDALAVAVLLVDRDLRLVHANSAASAMLAAGDPLLERAGFLRAKQPLAAALALAVQQACDDEAALGRRGLEIPARQVDDRPCVLHVLPLRRGELRPGLASSAVAAIFVAPPQTSPPPPVDTLAALFDLTAAEARVFGHIAAGYTQAEIAVALGVSPVTIKTHLLRVFAKTGTSRQSELVSLGASLALPV